MKIAVCAVIWNDEGDKVLAVSRRGKSNDFGFPGGKVDPGETPGQAIVREVFEETGLKVVSISEIFKDVCKGETDYFTICYDAYCKGIPKSKEEGIEVKWLSKEELLIQENSFFEYNKKVFESFFGYTEN